VGIGTCHAIWPVPSRKAETAANDDNRNENAYRAVDSLYDEPFGHVDTKRNESDTKEEMRDGQEVYQLKNNGYA